MTVIQVNTPSITGHYLYSDDAVTDGGNCASVPHNETLNNLSRIPFLGIAAGVARCALAVIHSVGHLLAWVCTQNKDHLAHALKGCCEFLRGLIEATPLVGRIFAWSYLAPPWFGVREGQDHFFSFFLVKLYNPNEPDVVDEAMVKLGRHPLAVQV